MKNLQCDDRSTYLKDQKSIVIQIDIVVFESFCHFFEMHTLIVDGVEGTVIFESLTRNDEFTSRRDVVWAVFFVYDFRKMNSHPAAVNIVERLRIVYQHRQFLATNFIRAIAKHKQHGVDDIRFAASIRSDDCLKTLKIRICIYYFIRINQSIVHIRGKMDPVRLHQRNFWNYCWWFGLWSSVSLSIRSNNKVWWAAECKCHQPNSHLIEGETKVIPK